MTFCDVMLFLGSGALKRSPLVTSSICDVTDDRMGVIVVSWKLTSNLVVLEKQGRNKLVPMFLPRIYG